MKTYKGDVEVYCRVIFLLEENQEVWCFYTCSSCYTKKYKPHFPAFSRSSSYTSLNKFKEPACQIKKKKKIFKHRNYLIKSSTSNFSAWKFSLQRTKTDNALCHNEFPCEANNQAHMHAHTHTYTHKSHFSFWKKYLSYDICFLYSTRTDVHNSCDP